MLPQGHVVEHHIHWEQFCHCHGLHCCTAHPPPHTHTSLAVILLHFLISICSKLFKGSAVAHGSHTRGDCPTLASVSEGVDGLPDLHQGYPGNCREGAWNALNPSWGIQAEGQRPTRSLSRKVIPVQLSSPCLSRRHAVRTLGLSRANIICM